MRDAPEGNAIEGLMYALLPSLVVWGLIFTIIYLVTRYLLTR